MWTLRLPMRSVSDLRHGHAAHALVLPHPSATGEGLSGPAALGFPMEGRSWMEGFLLAVTNDRFFFRLQQQRSEDGVQKTRAVCKLQRAGLAGSTLSFFILHLICAGPVRHPKHGQTAH